MAKNLFFPSTTLKEIQSSVEKIQKTQKGPHFAAFDADGTLWDSDVGEHFFQYQIGHCDLPDLIAHDPWPYYRNLKTKSPRAAYLWLAQINQGRSLKDVRAWAQGACEMYPPSVFSAQKQLITWLQSQAVTCLVVTASVKWAVEPAAQLLGIPPEQVTGVQTRIDESGKVTSEQHGPITWREGKVDGVNTLTGGVAPIFCAGNTVGDKDLLEYSTGPRLALQTQTENNALFAEEEPLRKYALEKNWFTHHFEEGTPT